jgi:hypothetical protein
MLFLNTHLERVYTCMKAIQPVCMGQAYHNSRGTDNISSGSRKLCPTLPNWTHSAANGRPILTWPVITTAEATRHLYQPRFIFIIFIYILYRTSPDSSVSLVTSLWIERAGHQCSKPGGSKRLLYSSQNSDRLWRPPPNYRGHFDLG